MPKYFVRHESELRVRLTTYKGLQNLSRPLKRFISADTSQPSFVVYDLVRNEDGVLLPNGLGMDAEIEAPNMVEAIRRCSFAASSIIDALTLATQAEPATARFVLAYDASPGLESRELTAQNSLATTLVSRPLKAHLLQPIFDRINALRSEAQASNIAADRIKRIDRAISWLRKGIGETAMLDEFTAYWVGLEALDPIIKPVQKIFRSCTECGEAIDKCNHCGKEVSKLMKTTNVLEGVRFVMEDKLGLKKAVFNKVRSLRGALLHGGKSLGTEELELIATHIPLFRRGLIRAIGLTLGLSEDVTNELAMPDPRRMKGHMKQFVTELVIMKDVPSIDQIDKQPRIELVLKKELSLRDDCDEVSEKATCDIKEINCEVVPGTERKVQFLADPFSGVTISANQA